MKTHVFILRDLSENTLEQIQNLELTMSQATAFRQDSVKVQTETDIMIGHIQNISAEVSIFRVHLKVEKFVGLFLILSQNWIFFHDFCFS